MTGTSNLGTTTISSAAITQLKGPVDVSGDLTVGTLTVRQDANVLGATSSRTLAIRGGASVGGAVTVGTEAARRFGNGRGRCLPQLFVLFCSAAAEVAAARVAHTQASFSPPVSSFMQRRG